MHEFNKIIQESPIAISEPLGLVMSLVGLVFFLMQKQKKTYSHHKCVF
jgi:hypothetical protein